MNEQNLLPAIVFTTVALFLLFVACIVVILAAHKQRVHQKVILAETETRYQKELRDVATEVQEQLFSNLSDDLHNNIGQRLTLVHTQLQVYESAIVKDELLFSQAALNLIDAMKYVREMSHSFSVDAITNKGIKSMVLQEVARIKYNGMITVNYDDDDNEPELTPDQHLVVFRIFQEIVSNIFKHASASNISILLCCDPVFKLSISDDGIGFASNNRPYSGIGIATMKNRALLAGLAFELESIIETGTTCSVSKLFTTPQEPQSN